MFKIENIKDGAIESLIGVLIVSAAIASVMLEKASWTEAGIAITIGVGLLPFKLRNNG